MEDAGPSCATGETLCDGDCVDLTSDTDHCGACGAAPDPLTVTPVRVATGAATPCRSDGGCHSG